MLEGGVRRGPETSRTGIHRNLNIGTESRVQISDALGKELRHPNMSKLWDSKTGPIDRQTEIFIWRWTFIIVPNIFNILIEVFS